MIWFFLAGWIAGAVGMMLIAKWWVMRHMIRITKEEMLKELEEEDDD